MEQLVFLTMRAFCSFGPKSCSPHPRILARTCRRQRGGSDFYCSGFSLLDLPLFSLVAHSFPCRRTIIPPLPSPFHPRVSKQRNAGVQFVESGFNFGAFFH